MLRGVNKQIIEITQTESQYFEKAILFVRQEHRSKEHGELESKAREFVSGMTTRDAAPAMGVGVATQLKERVGLKAFLVKVGIGAAAVGTGALLLMLF